MPHIQKRPYRKGIKRQLSEGRIATCLALLGFTGGGRYVSAPKSFCVACLALCGWQRLTLPSCTFALVALLKAVPWSFYIF
jgi:hypothetical protein